MKLSVTKILMFSILFVITLSLTINLPAGVKYEYTKGAIPQNDSYSSPAVDWNKTYSVTICDYGAQHEMVKTQDGGYAIAGTSTDNSGFASSETFILLKTDSNGNKQWSNRYSLNAIGGRANSIIQTSDGGYAIVGFKSSLITFDYSNFSQGYVTANYQLITTCLLKINATGGLQWLKTYDDGGNDDVGVSVVQADDGGYAIVGFTQPINGTKDVYFVKTDLNGEMQWNKKYGLNANDCGMSLIKNSDGGYTIAGYSQNPDTGNYNYLLFKTDNNGIQQWSKVLGAAGSFVNSLIETNDGGYALIGYTSSLGAGKEDFYLVKTEQDGTLQWEATYGGINDDRGYSIIQTNDGYAIAGRTASFGPNNTAVFSNGYFIKSDLNGKLQYSIPLGGNNTDYINEIVQLQDGSYALAGYTYSGTYTSMQQDILGHYKVYSSYSLWLTKIASDGSSPPVPTPSPTPSPSPTPIVTPSPTPTQTPSTTPAPTSPTVTSAPAPTSNPTTTQTVAPTNKPITTISPTNLPATVSASTNAGSTVNLNLNGNITSTQISNITIKTDQSNTSTTISFTITGASESTGFGNFTIPKSAITYGTTPTILIDNQTALNQGYCQDVNNYYVWYTTHFSTHEVSIIFATSSSVPEFPYTLGLAVMLVISMATILLFTKRKPQKPKNN